MSPNRFCSLCGMTISDGEKFYDNFQCLNCYLKDHPLFSLQEFIYLYICSECGNYSRESKVKTWISPQTIDLMDIVKEAIHHYYLETLRRKESIDFEIKIDYDNISPSAQTIEDIFLDIFGTSQKDINLKHTQKIKVKIKYGHCAKCLSLKQMPIKSIIQLRVRYKEQMGLVDEALKKIQNHMQKTFRDNQLDYITKIEAVSNGVDVCLSTKNHNNKIIRFLKPHFKFITKFSKKLMGRDVHRGKDIYRIKSLIQFLPVEKGDVVLFKNVQFKVVNISKNKINLLDPNGNKIVKNYQFFFKSKVQNLNKK